MLVFFRREAQFYLGTLISNFYKSCKNNFTRQKRYQNKRRIIMEKIKWFTPEVCEELKYYVYRLIDPRNGRTFYVGKGKNNRVFAHAECVLAKYKDDDFDYDAEIDDDENLKYKTIKEIIDSGLEVIYIIHKYGLTEHDAFVVESALIDAYSIEKKLTNKIKGKRVGIYSSEPTNALTLQKDLCAKEYIDSPLNPTYIIIKVKVVGVWIDVLHEGVVEILGTCICRSIEGINTPAGHGGNAYVVALAVLFAADAVHLIIIVHLVVNGVHGEIYHHLGLGVGIEEGSGDGRVEHGDPRARFAFGKAYLVLDAAYKLKR